jgi:hypothetical protein
MVHRWRKAAGSDWPLGGRQAHLAGVRPSHLKEPLVRNGVRLLVPAVEDKHGCILCNWAVHGRRHVQHGIPRLLIQVA